MIHFIGPKEERLGAWNTQFQSSCMTHFCSSALFRLWRWVIKATIESIDVYLCTWGIAFIFFIWLNISFSAAVPIRKCTASHYKWGTENKMAENHFFLTRYTIHLTKFSKAIEMVPAAISDELQKSIELFIHTSCQWGPATGHGVDLLTEMYHCLNLQFRQRYVLPF